MQRLFGELGQGSVVQVFGSHKSAGFFHPILVQADTHQPFIVLCSSWSESGSSSLVGSIS
ncbi:hypothetical protein NC653_009361 [Populus alba x Populus x berolinensis]|uniref:Uncharacterized protein n=1 Tax=Populus alba x Populus x berolinensis TaxID=444605 RepID=A0AAD6WBH9_9ROSI|nr:hypothetical protein NC653_009361 [Populus alba x Populus x berolinensis]